jgi:hypothetical protein
MFNEAGSVGSVGFQALWAVQNTGPIYDAISFSKDTFVSTVHKLVSQKMRFLNVYPNRTLSQLLLLAPFSTLTVLKHSGYTCITAITLSNTQTPGKIHPPKCRGKEILRESSRIAEGKRLRVQSHAVVISGLLYPLPICRPNSVQSVSGQGIMNERSEYNLDTSGMLRK